ncbi:MAG: hypothetical protein KJ970_03095 [Candidatus Eisenbacteria bacterium]|uniref:Uncharacterized protein n=1 Tax=Eiseniibacteriota bacterium TaxID=2212470 RepID=A0A948W2F6_UNCEI|nr:hypothetical protein [Candidatus Eisenbacteria bacterium]MBU1948491.1 hypothetical protein [Candidatus Eisenbacteria bacterium]MBU2689887.1 hypothetical protein [Candidatus Eisenbacteria bacterium]
MAGNGRGIWIITTVIFLITTILFAYLAMRYKGQAVSPATTEAGMAESEAKEMDAAKPDDIPIAQMVRTQSAWETENTAAPMANVPIFELAPSGLTDPLIIELKTTVQWFVLIYQIPADEDLNNPEILIIGPGDRVLWGAGPLPSMSPQSRQSIAIPGNFLPRGEHKLIVKGSNGENLIYPFQLTRKRHPGEVTIGNQ